MSNSTESTGFKIWGLDDAVYGAADLAQLVEWTLDERIQADTWIHCIATRRWLTAGDIPELRRHFPALGAAESALPPELHPETLRSIKIFAELSAEQRLRLAAYAEVQPFAAYTTIMQVGEPADCMYFILAGRVRLRINVKGREMIIANLEAGSVFGQISLFDNGPRVTDAIAASEVMAIKVSLANFRLLCQTQPDIAVPLLLGLGRTLAARIRTDDKHLCEIMAINQAMQ
ncbi:MAG: cyclic nucleotide-binding domain-containing protein [Verrucomicrobia bacterium]|nr:MAG: cyclic nucleotide-binding domain-containing protein [Verrucomicrobiota bacterium]